MDRVLKEGRNCWRFAQASRLGFLVDAENYFRAFEEAVSAAQHKVLIVGWDVDSRMRLDGDPQGARERQLGPFLDDLIRRKPHLHAHLLAWDFSLIFALEREPFPSFKLGWRTHSRLHFQLDGHHPPAGSHHQKIVVVDDVLAFTGGIDLSIHRWDSREHRPADPRRIDPAGKPYSPFHDVQMALTGEAAQALGELVRTRWFRATGKTIKKPRVEGETIWPHSAHPALHNIQVAISRTEAAYEGRAAVHEIRNLYADALRSARRLVYIENQYLTAAAVGEVLVELLKRDDPPEIVIVLPLTIPGWLQQRTMGVLRARLLKTLRAADHKGRLAVYYPAVEGLQEDCVKVHAKVLIIDDALVSIGSANINNRSMGLDSECNVSFESLGDHTISQAIRDLRSDLLAEHLGLSPAAVPQEQDSGSSLISFIEGRRGAPRHLEPLEETPEELLSPVADTLIADPEGPVAARELIASYVPEEVRGHVATRLLRNALILVALASLAALWHFTPLHAWLNVPRLVTLLHHAGGAREAPVILWLAYLIGGLVFFPVTILIVVTAVAFGPPMSLAYAFLGCLSSASLNYLLGRLIGKRALDRMAGSRWRELRHRLRRQGLSAMIAVSLVPIAPFTLVTASAGALKIRYRDLLIGTGIGVSPGILGVTLFTNSLTQTVSHPAALQIVMLGALAAALAALILWIRHWLSQEETKGNPVACSRK